MRERRSEFWLARADELATQAIESDYGLPPGYSQAVDLAELHLRFEERMDQETVAIAEERLDELLRLARENTELRRRLEEGK